MSFKVNMQTWLTKEVYIGIIIAASCVLSFSLGRLSVTSTARNDVRICAADQSKQYSTNSQVSAEAADGTVIASKSGTKYHFPWCPGARTITEVNKIIFSNIQEARASGYEPASNCKGLQ